MIKVHHINCGTLRVANYPTVVCHCLLLEDQNGLALVDTGIGLLDVQNPLERLGQPLIDMAGFQFHEYDTAVRRIEKLGFSTSDVRHILLTHGDPDHAGGLADFPNAKVHLAEEELASMMSGHPRYVPGQFAHQPHRQTYRQNETEWFGLPARPTMVGFSQKVLLIPLFGHTAGHCGVAVQQGDQWVLHAGDAYYLQAELTDEHHPVSAFAVQRADNDEARRSSLSKLRQLLAEHGGEVEVFGYHDISELPDGLQLA